MPKEGVMEVELEGTGGRTEEEFIRSEGMGRVVVIGGREERKEEGRWVGLEMGGWKEERDGWNAEQSEGWRDGKECER